MPCSYPIVSLILCALEKSNKSNTSLPSFLLLPFTQPVNHHLESNPNPPTYLSTPFSRGAKMRNKGQNQSKFIRFITIPIRVLGKARDLYVRSLTDCSHRVSHSDSVVLVTGQSSVFPRSFSGSSSRSNDNEDYRDLIRAASVRGLGHRNEIDMLMKQQLMAMVESRGLPKSCSVGMGRIDEDEPCEFGEEDSCEPKVKSDLVYPRSKSCAVGKKTVLF